MTLHAFFFTPQQIPSVATRDAICARYGPQGVVFAHVSRSADARAVMPASWSEPPQAMPLIRGGRVTVVPPPHPCDLDDRGACRCGCGAARRADGGWYDSLATGEDGRPLPVNALGPP